MKISRDDAQLFFELFLPLLDFTNKRFNVFPCNETFKENFEKSKGIDIKNALSVANTLWTNDYLIDEYLKLTVLDTNCREIVSNWKRHITGKFILERHLKKGSIFIRVDDEKVYLVKGLHSTWSELINGMPTPVLLKATLLPWKDVIISDGLVTLTPVYFGKGYSLEFKEIYLNAKHNNTIFLFL